MSAPQPSWRAVVNMSLSEKIIPISVLANNLQLAAVDGETRARVQALLSTVTDPELPMLSIADLGILRGFGYGEHGQLVVKITPTYSGCPAVEAIRKKIVEVLADAGFTQVEVVEQLAPVWTTEWMTDAGKAALQQHGIVAPMKSSCNKPIPESGLTCPQCQSTDTTLLAEFGSTACKAMYNCGSCFETFDYFKAF